MKEQLEKIKQEAVKQIEASDALDRLNEIRVAYLGKKGELTSVLKGMKNVAPEERPKVGLQVDEKNYRDQETDGQEGQGGSDEGGGY